MAGILKNKQRKYISYLKKVRLLLLNRIQRILNGVVLDRDSELHDYSVIFKNVALINSKIDAYSYIQSESLLNNTSVGKFCSIAKRVSIGLVDHPTFMVSSSPVFYDNTQPLKKFLVDKRIYTKKTARTIIESDVWIGQGVMIKAGVKIGVGAVIGAGSILTKDVAPYSISAGNPCKHIKYRFSEDLVGRLVRSKWWTLSDQELEKLSPFFVDPLEFLDKLGELK